jgi:hypothetical protein
VKKKTAMQIASKWKDGDGVYRKVIFLGMYLEKSILLSSTSSSKRAPISGL